MSQLSDAFVVECMSFFGRAQKAFPEDVALLMDTFQKPGADKALPELVNRALQRLFISQINSGQKV